MTKAYKVAEHVFCLEIPEESPLWARLGQYSPFEVELPQNPLFTLRLVSSLEPVEGDYIYSSPKEPGEPLINLKKDADGWYSEMSPECRMPVTARMKCTEDFSSAKVCIDRPSDAVFGINNALMLLYAFSTATLGTLEMHASVIKNGGRGYLFLGKSGTGKSTHSSLWLKHIEGSELLNDDNPIVRIFPDGKAIVYGSPWSGKTPCYKNDSCPIGGFVRISRSLENRLDKLSLIESYASIYSSCSGFKADRTMADGLHATLAGILEAVPCYVMNCRPDEEAARVCAAGVGE